MIRHLSTPAAAIAAGIILALAALAATSIAEARPTDRATAGTVTHTAELAGPACREVRPQGVARYAARSGKAILDVAVSQVLCHQEQTLVVVVNERPVGRIYIHAGGRGVAHFESWSQDGFPRVNTGDRIVLRTMNGRLVMGGVFR